MTNFSETDTSPKIVWLLQVAGAYWQPIMAAFSRLLPNTMVFTAEWPGYLKEFEDSFKVQQVGHIKVFSYDSAPEVKGYGKTWTYLSPAIAQHLLQFNPDVIFSTGFSIWTMLALALKLFKRWKVVVVYDGSSPTVDYSKSWLRSLLRKIMTSFIDAFITNSKAGELYLINDLAVSKHRVFTRPYLIPSLKAYVQSQKIYEEDFFQSLQHPTFSFAGNLIPRKGVIELLKACVILNNQGIKDYSLLLIGDGEQRAELEEFVQKNELVEQVHFIGAVNYEYVGSFLKESDVFVFPTFEDVWGLVVVEAMLVGKPILCSKWAGVSELVVDGENGYIFDPGEPKELAQLMISFIQHLELVETMGKSSREIMSKHTVEDVSESLSKVVEFVLAR